MRADAKKNYELLLSVAHDVVTEHGADASLRDIARKAEVGLGTLYRHFPTRESLLEALLREDVDTLTAESVRLEESRASEEALIAWLRGCVALNNEYRGVTNLLTAALEDPESALYNSCVALHDTGSRLLARAQAEGIARTDVDGTDLFALVAALAWLHDQPALAPRADHLLGVVSSALLTGEAAYAVGQERSRAQH